MREIGMSTRAIAAATGTSQTQVRRDLLGEPNGAPANYAPVTGMDGKTYPSSQPRREQMERFISR